MNQLDKNIAVNLKRIRKSKNMSLDMLAEKTGIVRDIRIQVYNKVLSLPLSFFSEERKGDIIARMSADVTVVENSLTSSIDMLIRNPIALLVCFVTLFSVSE